MKFKGLFGVQWEFVSWKRIKVNWKELRASVIRL